MAQWWGGGAKGIRGDRRIRVISVDIGQQIGMFSLRGHAQLESGGGKGMSAEDENIDILRENIDT